MYIEMYTVIISIRIFLSMKAHVSVLYEPNIGSLKQIIVKSTNALRLTYLLSVCTFRALSGSLTHYKVCLAVGL